MRTTVVNLLTAIALSGSAHAQSRHLIGHPQSHLALTGVGYTEAEAKISASTRMFVNKAKKRADKGDSFAQAVLALHYQLGWETEKNPELAVKYALDSANAGNPLGQFRLGALLREGEGVTKDEQKGLAYQAASFNGLNAALDPYSITALGILIYQGRVVAQGMSRDERWRLAAELYRKAAVIIHNSDGGVSVAGYAAAQYNYAMCLQEGHGVPKDPAESRKLLIKAANQNYPPACRALTEDMPLNIVGDAGSSAASEGRGSGKTLISVEPRVVYQEVDFDVSPDRIASMAESKSLRVISLVGSPYVFVFDRKTRKLLGSVNVGGMTNVEGDAPIFLNISPDESTLLSEQVDGYWEAVTRTDLKSLQADRVLRMGEKFFFRTPDGETGMMCRPYSPRLWVAAHRGALLQTQRNTAAEGKQSPKDHHARGLIERWKLNRAGASADYETEFDADEPVLFFDGIFFSKQSISLIEESVVEYLKGSEEIREVPVRQCKSYLLKDLSLVVPTVVDDEQLGVVTPEEQLEITLQRFDRELSAHDARIQPQDDGFWKSVKGERVPYPKCKDYAVYAEMEGPNVFVHYLGGDSPYTLKLDLANLTVGLEPWSGPLLARNPLPAGLVASFAPPTMPEFPGNVETIYKGGARDVEVMKVEWANKVKVTFPVRDFKSGQVLAPEDYQITVPHEIHPHISTSVYGAENGGYANGYGCFAKQVFIHNEANPIVAAFWYNPGKHARCVNGGVFDPSQERWTARLDGNDTDKRNGSLEAPFHYYDETMDAVWRRADGAESDQDHRFEATQVVPLEAVHARSGDVIDRVSLAQSDFEPETFALDDKWVFVIPEVEKSTAKLFSREDDQTGHLALDIFWSRDGGFLAVFPGGEYAGQGAAKLVAFADSDRAYPFEQFDLRLNRPDIILRRLGAPDEAIAIAKQLRLKRLKRMGVTEEMLKADFHVPEVEIVGDIPATTEAGEINFSIKASDSKYPLQRLKVSVNNVPVNGRDGELLREESKTNAGLLGRISGAFAGASTGPQTLERTIPIKLAAGRNKIQVSVLNNAGAESLYANAEVNCTAKRPKPTLYAVAMGVSEYSNPDWNLKYAAKDARDVLERLRSKAGDNYGEVKELLLTDKEVTKESIANIRDFLSGATIDDTVLMFVAGHGLLDSKYDYYFGTTDIDFNNPAAAGIAFEEFDDLLADLPSLKKSLLIDTCHAGELDDDEKTLLASAGGVSAPLPASNGIAMRSIGTRGMNVKAVEGARGASEWYDRLQGLFVDLRRGSGSTILSSSAGAEYALESSEQQNGLFTYAVLEALDGKNDADTNKDGSVQMSELGEYVKKRVAELTNNKQTPNTRRVNLEGDFTVAKTR